MILMALRRVNNLIALSILICTPFLGVVLNVAAEDELDIPNAREKDHYTEGSHSSKYDHELFLGDEAKTFDQLPSGESQRRLGLIVDKIDKDKDNFVTTTELEDWIRLVQRKYVVDSVERSWETYNPKGKEFLTWKDYSDSAFNYMKGVDTEHLVKREGDTLSYQGLYDRDKRRFHTADENGDGMLSKKEFYGFLHPDENPKLQDLVVLETIESMDKDNDGKISLEEFKQDIFRGEPDQEPMWMQTEIDHFNNYRDKNKDGFMDKEEVRDWVAPKDYDRAEAETRHLIHEADKDKDGKLSRFEILSNFEIFVGSQATDYGDALIKHDEF